MNEHIIKKQFPVYLHEPSLAYLDSAATTLTPQSVLDAMNMYYSECPVNVRRGMYALQEKAGAMLEDARKCIADFICAAPEEIIFTSGTTCGINMLARMLAPKVRAGSNIVLTRVEHHANLIPWQELAKQTGAEIRYIELTETYAIDEKSIASVIDENTAIVSFTLVSNVLGTILPQRQIIAAAKAAGAMTIIDAAQAVAHMSIDVKQLDCDFLAFSGHKMYGPKGVGVLYGKKSLLDELEPVMYGGEMIREVSYENATWADAPQKFEAGTQNIPAIIGLGAAAAFIQSTGWEKIIKHEAEMTAYAIAALQKIKVATIVGPSSMTNRSGVISFVIDGIHPHDISEVLNTKNAAVRVGHHCAMPLMKRLGLAGTVRISFGVYSSKEDVDIAAAGICEAVRLFGV